jgi:hypothetical protein
MQFWQHSNATCPLATELRSTKRATSSLGSPALQAMAALQKTISRAEMASITELEMNVERK